MTVEMPANVLDAGAQLVHPAKAFILRHIPLPSVYEPWPDLARLRGSYRSERDVSPGEPVPRSDDPELYDYLLRLHGAVETLFGPMDFDLHHPREYEPSEGLPYHQDHVDARDLMDDRTLVRMATCIHNASDTDRVLSFRRPTWTKHTEAFGLPVPSGTILAFSSDLITEYEHGIPPSEDINPIRSVVTRFSLWEENDE